MWSYLNTLKWTKPRYVMNKLIYDFLEVFENATETS